MLTTFSTTNILAQTITGQSNSLEIQITDPELAIKTVKPQIRWIVPSEVTQEVDKETLNLKLGIISKTEVVKVTLVVNNEVVEIFENFTNVDPGYKFDAWLEKTVQLQAGSNDLQLIVQNEQGALKHQRKIEVNLSPSLRTDHALVFGIDEYDNWENLQGPIRDAERIARVLEEKEFSIEIIRNSTTFGLLDKLEQYVVKQFKPHDQLFIYFAGHGYVDEASGEGYVVCKNSVNLLDANTTYISYSAIKSIINTIPAQHIFILMDAVKGRGEGLSEVLARYQEQPGDTVRDINSTVPPNSKTRLGILSGGNTYPQGMSYNAGSPLSKALVSYLRKSEQAEQPTWGDLLQEFDGIDPEPVYVEFGDHQSGSDFMFRKPRSGN
jgi:hypothetical protein